MPETLTILAYSFDELSDSAKETAREEHRKYQLDYEWWDGVYEDAKMLGDLMGIRIDDISFSGFCSQGDGASFTGTYDFKEDAAKKIREHIPEDEALHRIVDELMTLQVTTKLTTGQTISASITSSGNYCHSMTMRFECSLSNDEYGEAVLPEKELADILRSFADWIYRLLETEADYLQSDGVIDESIHSNGLRFDEDGHTL